jgi:hypothetical protein
MADLPGKKKCNCQNDRHNNQRLAKYPFQHLFKGEVHRHTLSHYPLAVDLRSIADGLGAYELLRDWEFSQIIDDLSSNDHRPGGQTPRLLIF